MSSLRWSTMIPSQRRRPRRCQKRLRPHQRRISTQSVSVQRRPRARRPRLRPRPPTQPAPPSAPPSPTETEDEEAGDVTGLMAGLLGDESAKRPRTATGAAAAAAAVPMEVEPKGAPTYRSLAGGPRFPAATTTAEPPVQRHHRLKHAATTEGRARSSRPCVRLHRMSCAGCARSAVR